MRSFLLVRDVDVSGVSGTGVVAEGVEFSDGAVALHWLAGEVHSTAVFGSLAEVRAVHGHNGATRIVTADGEVLRRLEQVWQVRVCKAGKTRAMARDIPNGGSDA
mgnify:CR=1 FL=1